MDFCGVFKGNPMANLINEAISNLSFGLLSSIFMNKIICLSSACLRNKPQNKDGVWLVYK